MSLATLSMRARLAAAAAGRAGTSAVRRLLRSPVGEGRGRRSPIEQLLLSPQDLRTCDPSFASEIYHGHFGLAGAVALIGSESPFKAIPPSPAWERELHGFGWLRHLNASRDEIAREHARALVRDWMALNRRPREPGWHAALLARRVISWLSHSRVFLEGAGQDFYESVMDSLTRQVRYLRVHAPDAPDGAPRLIAHIALCFAELCTSEQNPAPDALVRAFSEELNRQILADGGHVSRNPAVLIELLLDLLPLRQCFIARDRPPPEALISALDRMMPAIRFFRHGDGSLARFNGCGATPSDHLAAVLAHDDSGGSPLTLAEQSGYCRLAQGDVLVLMDCGRPPPLVHSNRAHAGCLSFEMSSGRQPMIVNCGAPSPRHKDWRWAARTTAAHSTLVVVDASSGHFADTGLAPGETGGGLLSGPANVTATLNTADDAQTVRATHDGYNTAFGLSHARRLGLSATGEKLSGEDILIAPHGIKSALKEKYGAFAIRFHLHPDVSVVQSADRKTVLLTLADEEQWRLISEGEPLVIEEGAFLADHRGPRRTNQVVLHGTFQSGTEKSVTWAIEKVADGPEQDEAEDDAPEAADLFADADDAPEAPETAE